MQDIQVYSSHPSFIMHFTTINKSRPRNRNTFKTPKRKTQAHNYSPERKYMRPEKFLTSIGFLSIYQPYSIVLLKRSSQLQSILIFLLFSFPIFLLFISSIFLITLMDYFLSNYVGASSLHFIQYYFTSKTDSLFMTTSKTSFNTFHCNLSTKSSNKQQLIVEINIGKKGLQKQIRLSDIHDVNNIDEEIKIFIHNNGLKEAAFSYIKNIICKQISHHQLGLYFQCPQIASRNCRCSKKTTTNDHNQKHYFDATFSNGLACKSFISGFQETLKKQASHLMIKITPKIDKKTINTQHEDASSFVFNSQFTLPSSIGQKERFFLTDQLYQNVLENTQTCSSAYFSSMSQFRSKERGKQNKIIIKINDISMKRPTGIISKTKQTIINKNSLLHNKTPLKIKTNSLIKLNTKHATPLRVKGNNILSTKQRKSALMTPQKSKACEAISSNLIHLNSHKLQSMVLEHKKILKDTIENQQQTLHRQSSFPRKDITASLDTTLYQLFQKLIVHNPPQMQQIHSQYVSYQLLSRQQLHFMGLLFQRIDHNQLNNLNYSNFRANSIKHCWKQLQDLISSLNQSKRASL